jgi:hypothetical protein
MRRSLSVRIATLVLVASMAAPAFAAPRGDDSPIGQIERAITRVIKQIKHFLPLTEIQLPKP